jgi:hypothetical protein
MSCTVSGRDGARSDLVQRLQHLQRALGFRLGAVDLELLMPVGNADRQRQLDGAQVGVGGAAQVGRAGVVGRREGVTQNQGMSRLVGWIKGLIVGQTARRGCGWRRC